MRPFAAVEAAPRHAVRRTGILLGLVTAPASVAIGAASVALPTIASSLHGSFGSTAWVIAAWALGAAVSMPLMGRAAQRNGVRATLIAAAAMLTFGSVLAALGPSLLVIVIGRLIGGLGAGGTVISVYRYVDHVFTGADRTTALSIVAACVATTSGMGTLVVAFSPSSLVGDGRSPYQRWWSRLCCLQRGARRLRTTPTLASMS
jgi:MFS family permease